MFRQKPVFKEIQLGIDDGEELMPALDDLESPRSQQQFQTEEQELWIYAADSYVSEANENPEWLDWTIPTLADDQMTFAQQNYAEQPLNDTFDLFDGNSYQRTARLGSENYENNSMQSEYLSIQAHRSDISNSFREVLNPNMTQYYNRITFKSGNQQDTCCICINEFQDGEGIVKLHCKHDYHQKCIEEWIKNQKICPLCKAKIQKPEKQVKFQGEPGWLQHSINNINNMPRLNHGDFWPSVNNVNHNQQFNRLSLARID